MHRECLIGFLGQRTISRNFLCQILGVQSAQRIRLRWRGGRTLSIFGLAVVFIIALYLINSIKILSEYERGVIFRLGRVLSAPKGPGIILVFAPLDRIVRVDLRQIAFDVPPQDIITRDNVTLKVSAVIFLRVIDPQRAVLEVLNYQYQTSQFAQTTLRSVLGEVDMDELLAHREKINLRLQSILDHAHGPLGRKGHERRGQAGRPARRHDASHGQAGRGRTRKAIEDHSRRGRVRGCPAAGGRGSPALQRAFIHTASLLADAYGNRCRKEHDHHLPRAGRSAGWIAEAGDGTETWRKTKQE